MFWTSRRVAGSLLAVLSVTAVTAMAAPANAQINKSLQKPGDGAVRISCGTVFSDKDNTEWDFFTDDYTYIRSGPSYDCQRIGQGQRDEQADYHCFIEGENGTWTYLRDDSTGAQGWAPDDELGGGGSNVHC
jgi:hypothetical protein